MISDSLNTPAQIGKYPLLLQAIMLRTAGLSRALSSSDDQTHNDSVIKDSFKILSLRMKSLLHHGLHVQVFIHYHIQLIIFENLLPEL